MPDSTPARPSLSALGQPMAMDPQASAADAFKAQLGSRSARSASVDGAGPPPSADGGGTSVSPSSALFDKASAGSAQSGAGSQSARSRSQSFTQGRKGSADEGRKDETSRQSCSQSFSQVGSASGLVSGVGDS